MRQRSIFPSLASLLVLAASLLLSCGEDRSGEYYALVGPKTWIYETLQVNYLFYEDLPEVTDKKSFFKKPADVLQMVLSKRDQKNGTYFSHVDSVFTGNARAAGTYPSFGFEGAIVRTFSGDYAIHVLYTQPDSPAEQAGLKRGDWIIAADQRKIASDAYEKYVSRPAGSHAFTLGRYTGGETFDTLRTVQMPSPVPVAEKNLLACQVVEAGQRKAGYIVYNAFGATDKEAWVNALQQLAAQGVNDLIVDFRYNPGGYVSAAQEVGSLLAPAACQGQTFLKLTFNDQLPGPEVLTFGAPAVQLDYDNLYFLTSGNTASAAEIVINCLRPYMSGRIYQVGEATFGKNVAQSLFTNEAYPQLELWITTSYLSNAEDFMDYYEKGLEPDYAAQENPGGDIVDFGDASDPLLAPVLTRMATGSFPTSETDQPDATNRHARSGQPFQVVWHPLEHRPKYAKR